MFPHENITYVNSLLTGVKKLSKNHLQYQQFSNNLSTPFNTVKQYELNEPVYIDSWAYEKLQELRRPGEHEHQTFRRLWNYYKTQADGPSLDSSSEQDFSSDASWQE